MPTAWCLAYRRAASPWRRCGWSAACASWAWRRSTYSCWKSARKLSPRCAWQSKGGRVERFPLGYNTYSIRALRWNDMQLIEYASSLKLDAIFLQDSIDPGTGDPAHWKAVKDAATRAGLWLGTGGGAVLPRDASEFDRSVQLLGDSLRRAAGMGSPVVRTLLASDRDHLPPGPPAKHIETMIKVLRAVRSQAIDGAGKEFVGAYLDTGNPVFVMEDPMQAVETLGPVAVMLHLRDSVVYESRGGIAVQW